MWKKDLKPFLESTAVNFWLGVILLCVLVSSKSPPDSNQYFISFTYRQQSLLWFPFCQAWHSAIDLWRLGRAAREVIAIETEKFNLHKLRSCELLDFFVYSCYLRFFHDFKNMIQMCLVFMRALLSCCCCQNIFRTWVNLKGRCVVEVLFLVKLKWLLIVWRRVGGRTDET